MAATWHFHIIIGKLLLDLASLLKESKLIGVKGSSDRVITAALKLSKKFRLKIIQIYTPLSTHPDEEVDNMYDEIEAEM